MLFGPQKADEGHPNIKQEGSQAPDENQAQNNKLPSLEEVLRPCECGCHQSGDLVALCRGSAPFPCSGVHVFIRAKNPLVGSSTSDNPQLINIDVRGWVHDLGGFKRR